MSDVDPSEWAQLTTEEKKQLHPSRLGRPPTQEDVDNIIDARSQDATRVKHVQAIMLTLADVTQGCIATERAERIATLAIDLALRNLERK